MTVPFDFQVAHEESSAELIRKGWYTVAEICELFRFSPIVVRMAARHGELRAVIIDHHVYGVRRTDLLAWLQQRAVQ